MRLNTILIIIYALTCLWAIASILLHGNRPTKSISWVFTVLIFPFAGVLLYYLFGVNRRKFKPFYFKTG
ncbi:PLDc N-terminal domain-containing protein [Flagellimonas sp. 389]|uniref:PLDc N-terminal domain-containing protein n=1 Tax=Flagellimonas sp. 389 TaxID=2835862 RepID=UPI001BD5D56D|nr:PLDc N-terminal domain-containing protein [Flagellimonas sp. 389]